MHCVQSPEYGIQNQSGFRVQGSGFRVQGTGFCNVGPGGGVAANIGECNPRRSLGWMGGDWVSVAGQSACTLSRMFDHTQLKVWQRADAFALATHDALRGRSAPGVPGLPNQLQRAAAAIAANISEGAGQRTSAQCARFLDIAIGSANEVQNHLHYAGRVELLPAELSAALIAELREIRMMLVGFRKWVINRDQR